MDKTGFIAELLDEDFKDVANLTSDRNAVKGVERDAVLRIPNEEVNTIFWDTVVEWFRETIGIKAAERSEMIE